jgi:hypothetical protein
MHQDSLKIVPFLALQSIDLVEVLTHVELERVRDGVGRFRAREVFGGEDEAEEGDVEDLSYHGSDGSGQV